MYTILINIIIILQCLKLCFISCFDLLSSHSSAAFHIQISYLLHCHFYCSISKLLPLLQCNTRCWFLNLAGHMWGNWSQPLQLS